MKYLFPLAAAAVIVLLGALRVSGTSTGIYNILFYGNGYRDPNLLSGQPRFIRTDEWMVQTPWTIAQARVGFNPENTLFAPSQDLTTLNVPVASWVAVFKPWLWPFFVLPLEPAFAVSWWLRSWMLLVSSYALLMTISKEDVVLSALGASAFLFSPFFQWWYESTAGVVDVASCALLASYFAMQVFRATALRRLLPNSLLFSYFALCFALILYPAAQIPVAVCCFFIGAGAILGNPMDLNRTDIKTAATALGIAGVVVGIGLVAFYIDFRDIIALIRHTMYPGQRRALGGSITPLQLVGGAYDIFLLRAQSPTALGANQSEASSFLMLSIFLLPILLFGLIRGRMKDKRTDTILLAAMGFCLLAFAWMLVGLPAPLAQVFLLQYVPPARMWIAVGIVNCFLMFYYLCRHEFRVTRAFRIFAWLYSIMFCIIVWSVGSFLRADSPDLVGNTSEVAVISTASGVLLLLLLLKRKYEFMALLLFFTLVSTFRVNPFYVGLSPVLDSGFSRAIQGINAQDGGASVWVVYDADLGNYLAANGVKVIGGTYPYPNMGIWTQLDPTGQYMDVYNRYSHTLFTTAGPGNRAEFRLLSVEAVQLAIDPCDARLRTLNVNYMVFFKPVSDSCLKQIALIDYPNLRIYIYQRKE